VWWPVLNELFTPANRVSWQTHLEHLNERNTEVEVCQVAKDQTQTEHGANWDDRAQVDTASHGNIMS